MKGYVRIVLTGLMTMALAYYASLRIVHGAGERKTVAEMAEKQSISGGLYMGLIHSPADYKLEMYRRSPADIVIIGSSRAMRFSQVFFREPIYNFGGLVYSPGQAIGLMRELSVIHRPRLMIYAVDFWTMCSFPDGNPQVPPIIPERVTAPFWPSQVNRLRLVADLLADGRLRIGRAIELMVGARPPQADGITLLGLTAALQNYGFGVDGAIYSTRIDRRDPWDAQGKPIWFAATHGRIAAGVGQYPLGCRPYPAAMERLREMQVEARVAGIELILLAPPVATAALNDMAAQTSSTDYIAAWLDWMAELKDPRVVLTHDARLIGSGDDEFEDGIHGGFVTHARLLEYMAVRVDAVRAVVDPAALRRTIEDYRHEALIGLIEMRGLATPGSVVANRP